MRGFDFPPTQGSSTKNAPSRSAVEPQRRAGLGVRGLVDPSIQVPSQRRQDSPKPPPPPGRRTPILPSTLPLTGNQDAQQPEGENHTPSALHAHHPLPRTQDHHDRADTTPGMHELPQGCNANEQRERAHQHPSDSNRGDEPVRHTRAAQDCSRPGLLSRPLPQNVDPYREEEGSKRKEEHGNTPTCQRGKYRLTVIMRMPNAARPTSSTPIT